VLNQCVSGGNLLRAGNQQQKGYEQPAQANRHNISLPDWVEKPPGQYFDHSGLPAGKHQ
jgi:hypothetical protein